MVLSFVRQHGQIKRAEVMELCHLSEGQAKNLLRRMVQTQALTLAGAGAGAHYRIGPSDQNGSERIRSDQVESGE